MCVWGGGVVYVLTHLPLAYTKCLYFWLKAKKGEKVVYVLTHLLFAYTKLQRPIFMPGG